MHLVGFICKNVQGSTVKKNIENTNMLFEQMQVPLQVSLLVSKDAIDGPANSSLFTPKP